MLLAALILGRDIEPIKIALQPLGKVSATNQRVVKSRLEKQFFAEVTLLPTRALPKEAFYPPRSRYRADRLLKVLGQNTRYDKVVGIASVDISTTKPPHTDWGVFGLGEIAGRPCVVSSFRLGRKGNVTPLERLCRVAIHEVGHTLGLDHCKTPRCTMSDAGGALATVDNETGFCQLCRRRVNTIR